MFPNIIVLLTSGSNLVLHHERIGSVVTLSKNGELKRVRVIRGIQQNYPYPFCITKDGQIRETYPPIKRLK